MNSRDRIARTSGQSSVDVISSEEWKTQIPGSPDSMAALVCDTARNIMSEGFSCHYQLAHVYRALGEQNKQIRQLASAVGLKPSLASSQRLRVSDGAVHLRNSQMDPLLQFEPAEVDYSHTAHRFSDSLSPSLIGNSQSSAMRLQDRISGTPQSYLESSSSRPPYLYTSDCRFSRQLFVYAIKQMKGTHWSTMYFLAYAETPSRWHRVMVIASSACGRESAVGTDVTIPDNSECTRKLLPEMVEMYLIPFMSRMKRFASVTVIPIMFPKGLSAGPVPGPSRVEELKDEVEFEHDTLHQAIQDIQDLGCKMVIESDVVVRSRIASSIFDVWVGSSRYAEQKVPYATAGKDGENGLLDFVTDMKRLHCLQGYTGIAGFGGVVLDDTRQCLKGYLSELPAICSLPKLFATLNSMSEEMPWLLRLAWAGQIVGIVAGLHGRGIVVGILDISLFGIREDGRAVLTRFQTSHRHLGNAKGVMPPELRGNLDGSSNNVFTFRTDIFQLGYVLWLLIQQKYKYRGMLCAMNACTKFPRHSCQEPHTNPVQLPYCGGREVPSILNDQIHACRSRDPKERPSACDLARTLGQSMSTNEGWLEVYARDKIAHYISDYISACAGTNDILVCCYECGTPIKGVYHHCDNCYQGDFDVCQTCFGRGVKCLEPQRHRLRRRFRTSETITHGSQGDI